MASLGRLCRGRSVKGASGGGCWKGAGSTLEEECWVVLGLISSSTRLQSLDSKGAGVGAHGPQRETREQMNKRTRLSGQLWGLVTRQIRLASIRDGDVLVKPAETSGVKHLGDSELRVPAEVLGECGKSTRKYTVKQPKKQEKTRRDNVQGHVQLRSGNAAMPPA